METLEITVKGSLPNGGNTSEFKFFLKIDALAQMSADNILEVKLPEKKVRVEINKYITFDSQEF